MFMLLNFASELCKSSLQTVDMVKYHTFISIYLPHELISLYY